MNGNFFRDIHRLINENGITEYSELMDYLEDNNMNAYYSIVTNEKNVLHFVALLESKRRIAKKCQDAK